MKVLWVIGFPHGNTANVLFGKKNIYGSGHWIDYTAQSLLDYNPSIELIILTTADIKETIIERKNGITYCCLNIGTSKTGKAFLSHKRKTVENIINNFSPDIIHIWGSETSFGLLVAESATNIPCVVCIQGLVSAIAKYPNGGLTYKLLTEHNFLDKLKYPIFQKIRLSYEKQAKIESKLLKTVSHVISESEWAFAFCKKINEKICCHWFPLQQNEVFNKINWDPNIIDRHSIICIASRGSYKGIHNAILALSILVKKYSDVMLYIPGKDLFGTGSIKERILQTPYTSYLRRLVKKHNLAEHIYFTGMLTPKEMAERMSKSNVFIMPSCIENQSATLREAMTVGTPVVTSYVGCIDESVIHNKNGFIYRYEEFEVLAHYIDIIFKNDDIAIEFSKNSREYMNKRFLDKNGGELLYSIYEKMMS